MEMEDGPPPAKRRANSRAPSDGREAPSISKVKVSAGRSSSAMPSGSSVVERRKLAGERRAASVQRLGEVAEEDEEEAEGGVKKKKMRKINIFGSSDAAASFNFGSQVRTPPPRSGRI
ncbi:hypothetical protein BDN72DRAFT_565284 [Pluteus cervinus]|uniref:Uncharacterized protein n=1 Tax=Pluteus cervinus TaxID=181527 RepID=A0ACD3BB03_9AGAR|nr:hypothetical protein BDN72DRAFT_565284 [Pluteus cervinus]